MKTPWLILSLLLAPAAPAQDKPTDTSVCEVVSRPTEFDGKMVRLRATLVAGFEIFAIRDPAKECEAIWLTYPGNGPVAMTSIGSATPSLARRAVILRRDGEFKRFETLLNMEMYPRERGSTCIACNRYEVTATMTGRIDFAGKGFGFGHLNGFPLQFVLERVTGVRAKDLSERYDLKEYSPTPVRFPTAYIEGKVVGPEGKPIKRAEVMAVSTKDVPLYMRDFTDWTDENGVFKLEVPPGTYVLGVNLEVPPSPAVPFAATYYPGSPDRGGAKGLTLIDRQRMKVRIRLAERLQTRRISVKVVWPDGRPVADANVWLAEQRNPTAVVGTAVSHTDQNGEFDLSGFRGIAYFVHANVYVKPHYVPYCAQEQAISANEAILERLVFKLTDTGEPCRRRD